MSWADDVRTLKVRTNADTQEMLYKLVNLGQKVLVYVEQNICSSKKKEFSTRRMITAETVEARKEALEKITISKI